MHAWRGAAAACGLFLLQLLQLFPDICLSVSASVGSVTDYPFLGLS